MSTAIAAANSNSQTKPVSDQAETKKNILPKSKLRTTVLVAAVALGALATAYATDINPASYLPSLTSLPSLSFLSSDRLEGLVGGVAGSMATFACIALNNAIKACRKPAPEPVALDPLVVEAANIEKLKKGISTNVTLLGKQRAELIGLYNGKQAREQKAAENAAARLKLTDADLNQLQKDANPVTAKQTVVALPKPQPKKAEAASEASVSSSEENSTAESEFLKNFLKSMLSPESNTPPDVASRAARTNPASQQAAPSSRTTQSSTHEEKYPAGGSSQRGSNSTSARAHTVTTPTGVTIVDEADDEDSDSMAKSEGMQRLQRLMSLDQELVPARSTERARAASVVTREDAGEDAVSARAFALRRMRQNSNGMQGSASASPLLQDAQAVLPNQRRPEHAWTPQARAASATPYAPSYMDEEEYGNHYSMAAAGMRQNSRSARESSVTSNRQSVDRSAIEREQRQRRVAEIRESLHSGQYQ